MVENITGYKTFLMRYKTNFIGTLHATGSLLGTPKIQDCFSKLASCEVVSLIGTPLYAIFYWHLRYWHCCLLKVTLRSLCYSFGGPYQFSAAVDTRRAGPLSLDISRPKHLRVLPNIASFRGGILLQGRQEDVTWFQSIIHLFPAHKIQ